MKDYSNIYRNLLEIIQRQFDCAFDSMQRGELKDSVADLETTVRSINSLITNLKGEKDDN